MRVLAIDPGERVGWAHGTIEDHALTVTGQGVTALKDFALTLAERIGEYDLVVYETWRLRADVARKMIGNDFQPSQLIGMIRLLAWQHPKVRLVTYGPNVKTTAIKIIESGDLPVCADILERKAVSSEEHDKDALDLLFYYWWERHYGGFNGKQT
jgi:hypothetical protein